MTTKAWVTMPNGKFIQELDLDDAAAVAAYNAEVQRNIKEGTHFLYDKDGKERKATHCPECGQRID